MHDSKDQRRVAGTLVDAVRALAEDSARGFVFVRPDGTERMCSFRDIGVEAERRGANLLARGLKRGDRLALVIPDGDEFVLSFLGAIFAGIVPVPLVPQLSFKNVESYHQTISHIARASGAAMLLTTAATRPYVDRVIDRVETLRSIFTVDEIVGGGPSALDVRIRPEDVAFLQFTSGSTSRPKGVVVTHANLAANSEAFMVDGLSRDSRTDKGVSWLPLFHDMGLIGFVVGPLFTNVPCVFLPTASFVRAPRIWLDKIHAHRGTITYAPNFAYALVAKRLKEKEVEGLDLSCVRVAGCGAEPIQAKALRDFAQRLAPAGFDSRAFLPSYGMAEATLAITFAPRGQGVRTDRIDPKALTAAAASPSVADDAMELVDCGKPFPKHEVAVVDSEGRRLPDRQVGQIVARGPSITPGYFNDPDLTAQTYRPLPGDGAAEDRWLHTGDLGYLVDGRLFVCGRVKDIIIVRGRNYYPTDIEWAIGELPTVRRGSVVAFGVSVDSRGWVADVGGDEQLVICCEGAASEAETIRESVSACAVAQFGLTPHEVVVAQLASLPRTSSGKPQRRKTRQMYLEGTLARARSVHASPVPTDVT
ncbi:MAG TPA: fatty acyl-AMP ligase [Polyangiaceae bacterium]|nr:fatty acyl-AMP ligase [Polyangiaceae bacterium]